MLEKNIHVIRLNDNKFPMEHPNAPWYPEETEDEMAHLEFEDVIQFLEENLLVCVSDESSKKRIYTNNLGLTVTVEQR